MYEDFINHLLLSLSTVAKDEWKIASLNVVKSIEIHSIDKKWILSFQLFWTHADLHVDLHLWHYDIY